MKKYDSHKYTGSKRDEQVQRLIFPFPDKGEQADSKCGRKNYTAID
ncbi:MAG: hypothetical protein IH931_04770 [candidate division Zixibacteria bacterium]|nr:hypothetical protein [candidate division Zixibacteria bacterium]